MNGPDSALTCGHRHMTSGGFSTSVLVSGLLSPVACKLGPESMIKMGSGEFESS